ncbi:hypothetical protein [Streptomyces sp. NBC_00690]|uniref:hypothetical protein n=1 Tax=Streptomyces sp. NBC_00690 TaxID=2975808 RepID=UPI002E2CC797|nr:hypothetical protein [Streptomyces sp. NBC_00690]
MTEEIPQFSGHVAALPALPGLPSDFRAFHQLYRAPYVRWAELFLGSWADAEEAVDLAFEQLALDWLQVLSQPVPQAYA